MLRKLIAMVLLTALLCTSAYAYRVTAEQRAVADKLIRLHIVANSDSDTDQAVKLRLRDAVLAQVTQLTAGCENVQQASGILQANLQALRRIAQHTLVLAGSSDTVAVTLQNESFSRRVYDTFSLPAGEYYALRIVIGEGAGHNWWCVAFPALCLPATTDGFEQAAAVSGFTSSQTDLLTGEETTVEIKFRTLQWLEALKAWLGGNA